MSNSGQQSTGTADPTYNIISVLYHALEGASTVDQYIEDARQAGDDELATYLEQVKQGYTRTSDQGKRLLAARIPQEG